tara:strand:- start:9001 stop:10200 length:1200 start_codon:yes stop_codon:yes gene_type:complete
MSKWKTQETRCISRSPRDRSRCKINIAAGEYLCEHHKYDLAAMANDPQSCIDIMAERFPKRHHPACDRKGENDCDCHDYSYGASAMITLKAAFEQSKLQSKLYKKHLRLTMADKVRRIRKYYRSISEDDLYLPPNSNFRQYRFFIWEPNTQRIIVKVLKDTVRTKTILLSHLRRLAPIHVYYTTGQWLNPQGIGPDPESRRGIAKMKKKGWCSPSKKVTLKRYHNTLLKRDLYFDVDYDNKDYHQGIQMVGRLQEVLDRAIYSREPYTPPYHAIRKPSETSTQLVFSGGKGFHLINNEYYDKANDFMNNKPLYRAVNHPNKNELVEIHYQTLAGILQLDDPDLLLDWMVTWDNRRIIRLPGTVHAKTMRVCTILEKDDKRIIFDKDGKMVGYKPDPPIP